jgi:hypothetical protein
MSGPFPLSLAVLLLALAACSKQEAAPSVSITAPAQSRRDAGIGPLATLGVGRRERPSTPDEPRASAPAGMPISSAAATPASGASGALIGGATRALRPA